MPHVRHVFHTDDGYEERSPFDVCFEQGDVIGRELSKSDVYVFNVDSVGTIPIPNNYDEAMSSRFAHKWQEAMDKEIAKLQGKSLNDAAHAIEVNADTLEHIVRQSGEYI